MRDETPIEKKLLESNETPMEELVELCSRLNTLFWLGEFTQVNEMLVNMPMTERVEILSGTLRFSWCAKKDLPDYDKVVNTVYVELERRGYDPKRILHGLYEGIPSISK